MDIIKILTKSMQELIAAGEVVERPASAVKELVENSIDAGATAVTVEINDGGITYIRVADNGSGMSSNDAETAFLRHATSKISTQIDLNAIHTMGFRGEALYAIAAVSRLQMMTKDKISQMGINLRLEGGEIVNREECGCPDGTTIIINDLFYNTPARLQFLKSTSSEGMQVSSIMEKLSLSHPDISFRLIKDGKEIMFSAGDGSLMSVIYAVYGKEFANNLLVIDYKYNDLHVSGYISKPLYSRGNRNMQSFFVNGRYIKNKTMIAAIEQGYKNSIMAGKFPACVLNLDINAAKIDVNVHPTKQEIKFSDEKSVFDCIHYAVKNALMADDGYAYAKIEDKPEPANQVNKFKNPPIFINREEPSEQLVLKSPQVSPGVHEFPISVLNIDVLKDENKILRIETVQEEPIEPPEFKIIGELFSTYILTQTCDEFLLIDKHAAHERIIFEKLNNKENEFNKQLLLQPVYIELSKEDYDIALQNIKLIDDYGFTLEEFTEGCFAVREVPDMLCGEDITVLIENIIDVLRYNKSIINVKTHNEILHMIACKAAVKAGGNMVKEEMNYFVGKLLSMPDIKYCPHGRPVIAAFTKVELEKLFKRRI